MQIPSFLKPNQNSNNNLNSNNMQKITPNNQQRRISYDPRVAIKEPLFSPKLTGILELTCFALAVAAITAGATLGLTPLIIVGLIAFALPFVVFPFVERSYY